MEATPCPQTAKLRTKLAPFLVELNSRIDANVEKIRGDFDFISLTENFCKTQKRHGINPLIEIACLISLSLLWSTWLA